MTAWTLKPSSSLSQMALTSSRGVCAAELSRVLQWLRGKGQHRERMNLQGDAEHQEDLAAGAQVSWPQPAATTPLSQAWGHTVTQRPGQGGFLYTGFLTGEF